MGPRRRRQVIPVQSMKVSRHLAEPFIGIDGNSFGRGKRVSGLDCPVQLQWVHPDQHSVQTRRAPLDRCGERAGIDQTESVCIARRLGGGGRDDSEERIVQVTREPGEGLETTS